jgi:hypothetical protein
MELFCKFIWRHEKFPNASRIALIASTSSLSQLMKIAASSAYMEVLHLAAGEGKGDMIPCWVAKSSRCYKGSMAKIKKSMGERGSP